MTIKIGFHKGRSIRYQNKPDSPNLHSDFVSDRISGMDYASMVIDLNSLAKALVI
jgi:hypothetical protein